MHIPLRGGVPHGTHQIDGRAALAGAVALVVLVNVAPLDWLPVWSNWPLTWVHAAVACALAAAAWLIHLPFGYVVWRLAWTLPFVAAVAISIPLAHGFQAGWFAAVGVAIRALLSVATLLVMTAACTWLGLLAALERFGMPKILVSVMLLMERYGRLSLAELGRMRRARTARSLGARPRGAWRDVGNLVGMLLLRSYRRAERVHAAMLSRHFDGTVRLLSKEPESGG